MKLNEAAQFGISLAISSLQFALTQTGLTKKEKADISKAIADLQVIVGDFAKK